MTLNRTSIVTHHRMCALGTTLLWKHMGRLMNKRKTFEFQGNVRNTYMTKDGKHLVLNGKRLYNIDKNVTTELPYTTHKLGNSMIEYDDNIDKSWIYTDDEKTYELQGHAYPNINKISLGYDEHYYETMDVAEEYCYDQLINRYVYAHHNGFSIMTKNTRDLCLTPEQLLVQIDRGTIDDSCYFQCDSQLFAFSETMRHVTYIYKNTLYFGETMHPFRLFTSEKLMDDIVSISMTGISPVVTHDSNKVTIFNYLRL